MRRFFAALDGLDGREERHRGQALVEYIVLLAFMALVVVLALYPLRESLGTTFSAVSTCLDQASDGAACQDGDDDDDDDGDDDDDDGDDGDDDDDDDGDDDDDDD